MTINWDILKRPRLPAKTRIRLGKLCLADFRLFCRLCEPPHFDWATGHDKLAEACLFKERGPDGRIRTLTLGPRGAGKTTTHEQRYVLWRIVRSAFSWHDEPYKNGSIRILGAGETREKAEGNGQWLIGMLEYSNVTKVYGSLRGNRVWGAGKFTISRRTVEASNPTWTAASPRKSTTGGHYDLAVIGDVVTPENTKTPERMMAARDWLEEIFAQVDPGAEIRVNGSRYHDLDMYGTLIDTPELWHCVTLTVADGFPNLDPEFLAAQRIELGAAKYSACYLNEPHPAEDRVFKVEKLHWIKKGDVPPVNLYMLSDVSSSEAHNACQTVHAILGVDAVGNKYLFDLARKHMLPQKSIAVMHAKFCDWHPQWAVMERRTLGSWVELAIDAKRRETGTPMPLQFLSAKNYAGKVMHINALEPDITQGRFYIVDTMPPEEATARSIAGRVAWTGRLIEDMVRFPRGKRLDALDAVANAYERTEDGGPACPGPGARRRPSWQPHPRGQNSPWHMPRFRRAGERRGRWADGSKAPKKGQDLLGVLQRGV